MSVCMPHMWRCGICSHVAVYKSAMEYHMGFHVQRKRLEMENQETKDVAEQPAIIAEENEDQQERHLPVVLGNICEW
jgi:hypothetical protein